VRWELDYTPSGLGFEFVPSELNRRAAGEEGSLVNNGADLAGLRVLIVEDDFLLAMELESLMAVGGCTALGPASSVRQALALIDGEQLDIALLDVNLKGERATPVAAALQERGVPYVLITGYSEAQLSEPELRRAPRLDKPVNCRALTRAVRNALQTAAG
jgi:DNA-binding LytR/AlgR family response regulator